jgi:hypothetical protein
MLTLGIIIFIIGCCVSSVEDTIQDNQINTDKRQEELIRALSEVRKTSPRKVKRTQRRIAKDKEGNMMAEEIIEEIEQ